MNGVFQDVRYAIRILVNTKGVTLAAILTLALGIGSNASCTVCSCGRSRIERQSGWS
jgi:hypothetical protein